MRSQPLPRLFLIYASVLLVPAVVAATVVSVLILHEHWTRFAMGLEVFMTLEFATLRTLKEKFRRRREAALYG
jgi:hypothetical protein